MTEHRIIGVVGAGTMGAGIAHAAAAHGCQVLCFDSDAGIVKKAMASLSERLDQKVKAEKLSAYQRDETMGRLRAADKLADLAAASFVIEAVVEDLGAKRKIFGELDRVCSPATVLASNTSSLSISTMAESLTRPERFVGMHFFNPAAVMPLVEVIAGAKSANQTIVQAVSLARALDKTPVKAKDRPGFIANRVARPFYLEALHLLERGCADVASIDASVRASGFKMGPFELLDLIGLDVNLAVTKSVHEGFGRDARFAPNAIQQKLVADERLGRKSGRGFYDYSSEQPTPAFETPVKGVTDGMLTDGAFAAFAAAIERKPDAGTWLFARIIAAVINEGAVTAGEGTSLPRDVDLAMTLGFNYPEGPMTLADRVGLDVTLDLLKAFDKDSPTGRHRPAPLIAERVAKGELGEKTASGLLWHSL